jgi:hypothetical protein
MDGGGVPELISYNDDSTTSFYDGKTLQLKWKIPYPINEWGDAGAAQNKNNIYGDLDYNGDGKIDLLIRDKQSNLKLVDLFNLLKAYFVI